MAAAIYATMRRPPVGALRAAGELNLPAIVGLDRDDLAILRGIGLGRLRAGDLAAAAAVLDYLCFLEPHRADAWDAVAAVRVAGGRLREARAAVETAAALDPAWTRAAAAARLAILTGDRDAGIRWTHAAHEAARDAGVAPARVARTLLAKTEVRS